MIFNTTKFLALGFLGLKHPDGRQAAFVTVDSGTLFHNIQTDEQMCDVLNAVNTFYKDAYGDNHSKGLLNTNSDDIKLGTADKRR